MIATQLSVFLVFALWYAATGSVLNGAGPNGQAGVGDTLDVIRYILTAMVAPGSPPENLHPSNEVAQLVTTIQSFLGIFLIGLLGFIAGNRIRR